MWNMPPTPGTCATAGTSKRPSRQLGERSLHRRRDSLASWRASRSHCATAAGPGGAFMHVDAMPVDSSLSTCEFSCLTLPLGQALECRRDHALLPAAFHRRVRGCDAALAEGFAHLRRAAPAAAGANRHGDRLSLLQQRPGAARPTRQDAARDESLAHRHRQRRRQRRTSGAETAARRARAGDRRALCTRKARLSRRARSVAQAVSGRRARDHRALAPGHDRRRTAIHGEPLRLRREVPHRSSRRERAAVAGGAGCRGRRLRARSSIRSPTTRVASKSSFL